MTNPPSYSKIILDLNNQVKGFHAIFLDDMSFEDTPRAIKPLTKVAEILKDNDNQALFRRNYQVRRQVDELLKTLRTFLMGVTIIPGLITIGIYMLQPKIGGHKYRNFWSIWSGVKNFGFNNHTKKKDCVLSLNAFFNHFKNIKSPQNNNYEEQHMLGNIN